MFMKNENGSLRRRLQTLESDHKLGKLSADQYNTQQIEILKLLEKLKEPLSSQEHDVLRTVSLSPFLTATSSYYYT